MLVKMQEKRNPHTLLLGMQTSTTTMEIIIEVPQKLKINLPYNPSIPLLGIYLEAYKSIYKRDTCTPMFIAALFIIAKLWKQPRCTTD
jgi:hypothetical protein